MKRSIIPLMAERCTSDGANTFSFLMTHAMSKMIQAIEKRNAPRRNVGNPFKATPMK